MKKLASDLIWGIAGRHSAENVPSVSVCLSAANKLKDQNIQN